MKIAQAAVGFYERDIEYNRNKILKCLKENSGKAELILFGETFLQGFEVLDWKYETDQHMALSVSDSNIQMIRKAAEENALAVSFGFLEKAEDKIYSSQLTIGADGNILNLFRRVSKGGAVCFLDGQIKEELLAGKEGVLMVQV